MTVSGEQLTEALQTGLEAAFGPTRVVKLVQIPGGASKGTWAVDLETAAHGPLGAILRRAGGGLINSETLTLAHEHRVLEAAFGAGVTVPEPLAYLPDCAGEEAILMRRVPGEGVGRRIVTRPELEAARATLPERLAEEFARIHSVPLAGLGFLPGPREGDTVPHWVERLRAELDAVNEAHPVIELALHWLERHAPVPLGIALLHGDLRLGNILVGADGLQAVIDWEFAHTGDVADDLAWPLVRAWRFGRDDLRLGGVGHAEPFLERYNALTGRGVTLEHLFFWEVMGNVKWAVGALTQARRHLNGLERSVEFAVLGRMAVEMEYELLHLLKGRL